MAHKLADLKNLHVPIQTELGEERLDSSTTRLSRIHRVPRLPFNFPNLQVHFHEKF